MTTRRVNPKRGLAQLCLGGTLFAVLPAGSCTTNAALTNLFTSSGDAVIDTAAAATGAGPEADAIIVQPVARFLQDLWTVFISLRIPADPVYQNDLLVQ